jgi:hypothetical protein
MKSSHTPGEAAGLFLRGNAPGYDTAGSLPAKRLTIPDIIRR